MFFKILSPALGLLLCATTTSSIASSMTPAQSPPKSFLSNKTNFSQGFPTKSYAKSTQDEQDFQRAVLAYRFWYPTVSAEGIFNGSRELGLKDNEKMLYMQAGPRQVGFTLNSDTPYAGGPVDLNKGPMVIEIPPGAFVGLVDDHNQGWIADLGLPGPEGSKGGKVLLLPPNNNEKVPAGYRVVRSPTNKVLVALRSLPMNGDVKAAMDKVSKLRVYPLSTASNPKPVQMVDMTNKKMDLTSLRWEDNLQFWSVLAKVISEEPFNPRQAQMYGLLKSLGIERGKKFSPEARLRPILENAAKVGRDQMLIASYANPRADRLAWKDHKWEWVGITSDPGFLTSNGAMDMNARDRWFALAMATSPAMFRRQPGAGSLYWLGLRDLRGNYLDGGKTYQLRIPLPVPANLFWSVTAYDAQTRSQVQTNQDKAAIRSLFEMKNLDPKAKEAFLYFGPNPPANKQVMWIKTNPGRGWFTLFRIDGPTAAAFDGNWKPGDFEDISDQMPKRTLGLR